MDTPSRPENARRLECPACAFAGASVERLIAHLRRAHWPAGRGARRAAVHWCCPVIGCPQADFQHFDAVLLCVHLRSHAPQGTRSPAPGSQLDLVPARSGSRERPIDKYLRAGLGKLPDVEVAAAIGSAVENVTALREALGMPPPRQRKGRKAR